MVPIPVIAELKPYKEYKESGLPWLGSIPSSWETPRTKTRFRLSIEKSGNNHGKELLSVYTHIGVRPRKDLEERGNKASTTNDYWVVRKGDIIVNKLLAWMGAVGVSHFDGVTSPAYDILRPIQVLEPGYYHLLFRTKLYLQLFKSRSRGIMDMRLRLYFDELGQIPLICPPPADQAAIVRFLDHWNGRLDKVIRAKRKQLSLISEMLMSVTQEAMAASKKTIRIWTGVEVVSRPVDRKSSPSFVRVGLYNRGRGIFQKPACPGNELGDSDFYWIEEGDLVISGQFAWEGSVALVRSSESGCIASHRYPVIRGRAEVISSPALLAILRSSYGAMILNENSRGAAGRNRPLNFRSLLKERIPIPTMADQKRIADLLEQEHAVSQSLMRLTKFINEYRTRLTADVVTGKLDVRAAAAQLPDTEEEPAAAEAEEMEEETELEDIET